MGNIPARRRAPGAEAAELAVQLRDLPRPVRGCERRWRLGDRLDPAVRGTAGTRPE